ncbi:MAG: leucine-rich repeat protein, partial [Paludibacteraceae bacterium]|nr:leucine-rich repeat protein [Paludibacteraceae bacterium]
MEAIIDGINYRLNKNNYTASVHRLGPCEQYEGDVNIPSHITYQNCTYTVTEIYGYGWGGAFDCCKSLISVTIPSTVQTIGTSAFRGCSSLVSVILTEGLKDIGPMAFEACKSLSYIEIPKSVTHIGWDAFLDTLWYENQPNGLVYMGDILYSYKGEVSNMSVIIDNGITIIADYAFEKIASKITSINIPNTVKYIGSGVFSGCSSLTFITIPDGVYEIGNNAFSCCSSLETIRIPDSVHRIGTGAFYACDTLKTVILSGNITSLQNTIYTEEPANGFFGRCKSLESIFIPASVKQIDAGTFEGCTSLVSIVVHPDNPVYDSRENSNAIIEKHTNKLIAGCYKTIIPIGVKSIGTAAFSCCESLNAIEIPETVTSIGDWAFWCCSSLVSISLPSKITDFSWRKEYYSAVFHGCESLQIIRVPKGKKEEYCKLGLEEYRDLIQEPQEEEYTILLNIAKGYELGIGMPKNLEQAVLIYTQAVEKGCAEAAFHLGELYELGDGLQQDYQQAIEWYTKAIALYHPSAETRKNHCEQVLRNEEQRMEEYQREIQSQFPQLPTTKYIFFDT